jgi:triosephosphate isomerase
MDVIQTAKELEATKVVELSEREYVEQMLDTLAELEANRAFIASEWAEQITTLEAYRDAACEEVDEHIETLKKEIKAATVQIGASVNGARLQAELFAFRTEGKPSCSIRVRRS